MSASLCVITFLLLWFFIYYSLKMSNEIVYFQSELDNNTYIIRRGNTKSHQYLKESANKLAEINNRILTLMSELEKSQDSKTLKISKKLKENYSYSILSEAAIDNRYTTYTINKQDMHICLRTRNQDEKLYDINLLMYVVLHELAHMCNYDDDDNPIQGHGDEFRETFKILVLEGVKANVYRYDDYYKNPKEYCGIILSSQIA